MRSVVVAATLVLAVACTKEPAAPAATVEAAPRKAPEAKPVEAAPVAGERLAFDQTHGKVEFVGAKVTGSHRGGFRAFSGAVTLPNGAPDKGAVEVTLQMASIFADHPKLEGHLKSNEFFDVANIPTTTFTSSEITAAGDGYTVAGDLTMHGVTKRITFPAKIAAAADKVTVNAAFSLNRKDFGIVYPGMPDDLIRDAVELELALAIPRGAAPAAAAQ